MIRLTRRYRFSASHRLHSPELSEAENAASFGKCNNPHGHGHNYELEVAVRGPLDPYGRVIDVGRLDRLVEERVLSGFAGRNLNIEVPEFRDCVPTSENLAAVIGARLRSGWQEVFPASAVALDNIRLRETRRNVFELKP